MQINHELGQIKRIWEMDCLSLDAALAASLDWKDLVNLMHGCGIEFQSKGSEAVQEMQAFQWAHRYCHSQNSFSLQLENLLNYLHQNFTHQIFGMSVERLVDLVMTLDLSKSQRLGGLFWGLGMDSRAGLDCLRRRFHQRYQIYSLRKERNHD